MSKPTSLTQTWLRQKVQPYANPDLTYAHADALLERHPSIRPKTDVYTYDDGRSQLLLCLHGLLPISFRGASYNIPVAVWIPREYPRAPPIPYVVPTSDMLVRSGPNIDPSGRSTLDYIRHWERKHEGCTLVSLLDAMQDVFSREPPVYAKPKDATPPPTAPSPSSPSPYAQRPPPQLSTERAASSPQGSSTPLSNSHMPPQSGPPPLPAKPGASALNHYAHPPPPAHPAKSPPPLDNRTQSPAILGPANPALATRPPPPLPGGSAPQGPDRGVAGPVPPSYSPHHRPGASLDYAAAPLSPMHPGAASGAAPHHMQPSPLQQQPWTPSPPPPPPPFAGPPGHAPYAPPVSPASHAQVGSPHAVPPPFLPPHAPPPPSYAPAPPPPSVPPPDLLSSDGDGEAPQPARGPAPPRPPNPELVRLHGAVHARLASELASLAHALALDAERLRANQADLLAGAPAVRDERARLEAVRAVCAGVAGRLGGAVAAAEANVAELRRKGDPEVDELVCAETIVGNQLVNLVAEDNAIEDTIYHLHRALNAGRIDLERFLRSARALAEEQFMKRALIEKIQAGMTPGEPAEFDWARWR